MIQERCFVNMIQERCFTKNKLVQFEGNQYEQVDGVAVGSPLGPLWVNICMISVEEKLRESGKMAKF